MKTHRGLIWGLGLVALLGLASREAQAGNLTITVAWGANSIAIDYLSPFAQAGGDADHVTVDTGVLNGSLGGSAYFFNQLGASSNNPGDPTNSNVTLGGEVIQDPTQAGGSTAITITASQDAFTAPTGPGLLSNASGGTYTNHTAGDTTVVTTALDATTLGSTYIATGATNPESYSNKPGISTPATAPGSYTLSDKVDITMAAAIGAKDGFSASGVFTAVPEPASIVMMVTGMPLPFVVLGLLRRRRGTA